MIESCPQCGYSLEGLPDKYNCPECAFPYDKDSSVVKPMRAVRLALAIANALTCIVFWGLWAWNRPPFTSVWVVIVPFVVMTVGHFWRFLRIKSTVVVSRDEVRILRQGQSMESYPMAHAAKCVWSWKSGAVLLLDTEGAEVGRISSGTLESHHRAKKLARLINQYRARRSDDATNRS